MQQVNSDNNICDLVKSHSGFCGVLTDQELERCSEILDAVDAGLLEVSDKNLQQLRGLARLAIQAKIRTNPDFRWRHDGALMDICHEASVQFDRDYDQALSAPEQQSISA